MLPVGYLLLGALVLVGAVVAVLARNLVRAALALGAGSAALAMLLFALGAPHAGSFELSVGAGLIIVTYPSNSSRVVSFSTSPQCSESEHSAHRSGSAGGSC